MDLQNLVVILRLDGGAPDEKGSYQCGKEGCSWEATRANRKTPQNHVRRHHPGCKAKLERLVPYKRRGALDIEEQKRRKSIRDKTQYERRRVSATHWLLLVPRKTYHSVTLKISSR